MFHTLRPNLRYCYVMLRLEYIIVACRIVMIWRVTAAANAEAGLAFALVATGVAV